MIVPTHASLIIVLFSPIWIMAVPADNLQPETRKVMILHAQAIRVRLSSGKPIGDFKVDKPEIIHVLRPKVQRLPPGTRDPDENSIFVIGILPGQAVVKLSDQDGKEETITAIVYRELLLFLEDEAPLLSSNFGKAIKNIAVDDQKLIRLEPVPGTPSALKVVGLAVGDTFVRLTNDAGATDVFEVCVRSTKKMRENSVLLSPDTIALLFRLPSKARLAEVANEKDDVLRISAGPDSSSVLINALNPGKSKVTFVDENGKTAVYEFLVRPAGKK